MSATFKEVLSSFEDFIISTFLQLQNVDDGFTQAATQPTEVAIGYTNAGATWTCMANLKENKRKQAAHVITSSYLSHCEGNGHLVVAFSNSIQVVAVGGGITTFVIPWSPALDSRYKDDVIKTLEPRLEIFDTLSEQRTSFPIRKQSPTAILSYFVRNPGTNVVTYSANDFKEKFKQSAETQSVFELRMKHTLLAAGYLAIFGTNAVVITRDKHFAPLTPGR